jgi:copper transport protein
VRRAIAAALLAALVLPATAAAHASVRATSPASRHELGRPPRRVTIRFDEAVDALPNAVRVYDARGRIVSRAPRSEDERKVVAAPLVRLPNGGYTVRWRVLSDDGHVVAGVFTFGVRAAAPEPTEAFGASGPTRTEHVVRWLDFVGLALAVGGLAFRLVILPRTIPPALEQRFYLLSGLGVVVVLQVGIVAFLLRAEDALQLPFRRFLDGDLSPIAEGTRIGTAFIAMTLGFAFVAALVFLAWLTDRPRLLWPALVLAAVFSSGLSLSGHSGAGPGASGWSALADWLHLTAASLWVGGLIGLLAAGELRRVAFGRFARLAPGLIALLLAAGISLSVLRLPAAQALWTTSYGRVLLLKIGLASVALSFGAVHHVLVRPRLDRPGVLAALPRSLAAETAVVAAVLLVAAILVDSRPPPQPASPAARATLARP